MSTARDGAPDVSTPHATLNAEPDRVVVSFLTGERLPVLASLPATHRLLPFILAHKGTRVRDVAPGVTLPEPDKNAPAPLASYFRTGTLPRTYRRIRLTPNHPAYRPTYRTETPA
ncbi:hypothetical protein [Cellulosimicrobium sp. TH-20]|uniref:hypothetical protein n=1 Tax=Cellulosimicrobium sp. TH-20 TaxID=1980001 RepID=UPI0011AA2D03|nr:hypothetical protein [Cellulosimicrobium sp. TH-20]